MSETVLVEEEIQNAIYIKPANTFGTPCTVWACMAVWSRYGQ